MRRLIVSVFLLAAASASADYREFMAWPVDAALQTKLRGAVHPRIKADDLAITLIDLNGGRADFNGDVSFYPASVIKIFFMADIYLQKQQNLGDVDRALKEMIVASDNDATAYLVDILAGTCAGEELHGRAMRRFTERRRDINRHFAKLGYDVSAMMKPWSFGPYGRELQLLGEKRVNRNRLTANATAALMLWIARRRAPGSDAMMDLLHRPLDPPREDENQVKEFIGAALPAGSRLWSKAGWTSEVRHDAAYIELPDGRKFVLVIFTRGQAQDLTLVPEIARNVLEITLR
ncbi:MAG: serine hydrolase [Thermoanaerobaculia bacterium]